MLQKVVWDPSSIPEKGEPIYNVSMEEDQVGSGTAWVRNRRFPRFTSISHPSVQNLSTFQLIYHL
jgi:hypothetical protein